MTLTGADPAQANVTMLLDGSTFLRCTGPAALADGSLVAAMEAAMRRIAAIAGTVNALSALTDMIVLGMTIAVAALSVAGSDGLGRKLLHALAVSAVYAALIPARRYALRAGSALVLRLASRPR